MPAIPWMQAGPFGLMVHFLSHTMPRGGAYDPDWNRVVDRFPVVGFCDQVAALGAKWLIFPFGQNTGYYCSPNAYLESLAPGHCSQRDLMAEIADELGRRGVRLIAYLPTEIDAQPDVMRNAFGWDLDVCDKHVFQERYMCLIAAWARHLGPRLSGWWLDGCYDSNTKSWLRTHGWNNSRFDRAPWEQALRAGNPAAIYAMNPGANSFAYVFKEEDYLAGEANDLAVRPTAALRDGMQWHALVWLDCFWGHWEKPGPIAPPRFTDQQLSDYLRACTGVGGAVTLNLGIYQDGSLPEASVAQVHRVRANVIPAH